MKVGVLGSGDVAKVLASGLLKHGHQVKVGSRTTGKLADWASQNAGGSVGSFAEAAEFGEFVVLAVKGNRRCGSAIPCGREEPGRQDGDGRMQSD